MSFKGTLFKSITALFCVVAICITVVIGTGKMCDAKIQAVTANAQGADAEVAGDGDVDSDVPMDESAAVDENGETVTDNNGDVVIDESADTSADSGTSAQGDTKTTSKKNNSNKVPSTAADIINYYNSATANVVSKKAGYSKTRVTDNEKIEANSLVKSFKSLIYKFMGIGAENKYTADVKKGNWGDRAFFLKSNLSASDVTSAKCTNANGIYTITLSLKSGSSSASKAKPTTAANSSLDRSGICVGTEDKGYFDHKTASVIYDAIAGTYAGAEVAESYSNAKVTVKINSANNQITDLKVEWNASVTISKILGMTASATGISHVEYKNFSY